MDPSPSFILVPPTHALSPQPSPTGTTATSNSSSIPELAKASLDNERTSSETTIVTIYSMYGEDEDTGSWSPPESLAVVGHRHRPSTEVDLVTVTRIPDYRHESFLHASGNGKATLDVDGDSAYYDATYPVQRPSSMRCSVSDKVKSMRSSVLSDDDSVQLAYTDSRPTSSYVRTSTVTRTSEYGTAECQYHRPSGDALEPYAPRSRPRSAFGTSESRGQRRSNVVSPEFDSFSRSPPRSRPPSRPSSRPNSQHRKSLSSNKSNGANGRATPASVPSPLSTRQLPSLPASPPEASSSPLPPSVPTSPVSVSPPVLQVPVTPPTSPPRASTSKTNSPESKSSITPSEGEDPDAFHVRSTYAHLDQLGVKGDGYVEGVERTRARVGGSRASELRAIEALADGYEKTRDLTSKEVEMLASLDRYGFFVTPSHDRLLLLPAAPLQKSLSHVTTFPSKAPPNPSLLRAQPSSRPPAKENRRTAKWSRMLEARSRDQGGNVEEWAIKPSKELKLRERTFKGIPDCWRAAAWEVLMNRFSKSGKREMRQLGEQYREALDKPSTYDVQIDLDVPRTITGHVMFRTRYGQGQRSLFHVLHCLSLHCEECGYCQGMGPIAATLLCYFDPERVYASLVRLHDSYSMHSIFSPGFPGLLEAIYVQERMTEQMMPAVYAAFKKHMISTTSYATKWYITLFANSVPFQTQLRLWDAFLLEGPDIFVVVAIAIVWVYRDHITSDAANFESVLSLLSSFFIPEDEDALLAWIEKVISDKKQRSCMHQWRQDWHRLVSTGQDSQALL